jgi:ParB family chromosome partitioning protein
MCANPECPIHNLKKTKARQEEEQRVEQGKRPREEAVATTAGLRVLYAITLAVPVRLLKRDLPFVAERLLLPLDERRLVILGRGRGIRPKGDEPIGNC